MGLFLQTMISEKAMTLLNAIDCRNDLAGAHVRDFLDLAVHDGRTATGASSGVC